VNCSFNNLSRISKTAYLDALLFYHAFCVGPAISCFS